MGGIITNMSAFPASPLQHLSMVTRSERPWENLIPATSPGDELWEAGRRDIRGSRSKQDHTCSAMEMEERVRLGFIYFR